MKRALLSLLVVFVLLLAIGYVLPVSPAMANINNGLFSEEDLPGVCSVFGEMYFAYASSYDGDGFILRPVAHLCLSAQLRNIASINADSLQDEVQTMKEVYLLDIENVDRELYRQIHSGVFDTPSAFKDNDGPYSTPVSSLLTEEEIFAIMLSTIIGQRERLQDKYSTQYASCSTIVTEDTLASNLSDNEWDCLKLGIKAVSRYYK